MDISSSRQQKLIFKSSNFASFYLVSSLQLDKITKFDRDDLFNWLLCRHFKVLKNYIRLHKTQFGTQCWGQKRPHASSEMDKLTSNTNEEDQIMASVARDLGEDLTAEPLVELNVLN